MPPLTPHLHLAIQHPLIKQSNSWDIASRLASSATAPTPQHGDCLCLHIAEALDILDRMGTWNTKPFGNDNACDWLWKLEQSKDDSVFKAAFAADAKDDETVAAAAVVQAARREPSGNLPPKAKRWVLEHGFVPGDALVKQAITAVERIKNQSELRELWAESNSLKSWLRQMDSLLAGLQEVQSLPPPIRLPKASPAPRRLDKLIERLTPDDESPLREKLRERLESITDLEAPVQGPGALFPTPPLTLLAKQGLLPEAKRLVERGARVNQVPLAWGCETPLEAACLSGHAEMARWLVEQGARITPRAVHAAVQSGSVAAFEVLVPHLAGPLTEELEKEFLAHPPLHRAVEANHPHLIEYMVKSGFSVDVRNSLEMTPLSWAALQANHKERRAVVEMLLSLGADPNAKDDKGFTPLDLISDPSKDVAVLIQKHGGRLGKDLPD